MVDVKEFDFKSVGLKSNAPKQPNPFDSLPIGIRTPMRLGQGSDGIFQMHFAIADQIRDNFRNLLLTNHGERVAIYNFGANLKPLSLELGSEIFDEELLLRINTAVSRFMPFIKLDRLEREIDNLDNEAVAKIRVKVFYSVPSLRIINQAIEVSFFIGG
jgi:phage baseplate assembly protein W